MFKPKSSVILIVTSIFTFTAPASAAGADIFINRANAVAQKISTAIGVNIDVIVIKDNTPEAFVYPGGLIVLTKGIMEIAKTDDELAFVIGHEIAHTMSNDNGQETIFYIINNYNLSFHIKQEIRADIAGMFYAEKAGFNPFSSVKLLTKMLKDPSQSFNERLEAMSKFLANKWDPYYWTE